MPRKRRAAALLVVLLVVGLGVAASTFQTARFSTPDPGESPPRSDAGGANPPSALLYVYVFLALALVFGSLGLAAGFLFGDTSPAGMAAFGVGIAALAVAVLFALGDPSSAPADPSVAEGFDFSEIFDAFRDGAGGGGDAGGGEDASEGEGSGIADVPPVVVIAALAGLLVVGLAGAVGFSGGTRDPVEATEDGSDDDATAVVGEAAGRAADRIGRADLSNAVYRAWRDMTDALDVADPETTTPAAFADAAVAAGLDERDVRDLTDLFREVRYGSAPATEERERRARETLRRIEAAYAEATEERE